MIRKARLQDRKSLYDLHTSNVTLESDSEMEFYFSQIFDENSTYVNDVNGHVEASVQVNYSTVIINGQRIATSVILGQIAGHDTAPSLDELMKNVLDELSHRNLLTLAITNRRDITQYGFEPVYKKKYYVLKKRDLKNRSYQGCGKSFEVSDLMKLYNEFTAHFNGFYLRNSDYWLSLFSRLQATRYNIAVYRDPQGVPQGYMIYRITQNRVLVDELIYLTGEALIRLLCYGFRLKDTVELSTSESEDITMAIGKVKCQIKPYIYARINNIELFNRLFGCNVRNTREAYGLSEKPAYINERC